MSQQIVDLLMAPLIAIAVGGLVAWRILELTGTVMLARWLLTRNT